MDKSDFIVWASKLQASYQPSEEVRQEISDVTLIAIVGPTGVGKTTLIEKMKIPNVLSDVSRDPRPDEKNGRDYHFRTDYLQVISDIKQGLYTQFLVSNNGEFYGTRCASYPESGLCTMAVLASALPVFREIGFKKVIPIYIMPPSYVEWMRRIGGVRTKDLLARIGEARQSILTALDDGEYHFVLNDTVESALTDIQDIINGDEPDAHRTQLAIGTADLLLERIGGDE